MTARLRIFSDYPNHDVREPLPPMTHAEWCLHLKVRNSLAVDHRRCLHSDKCMANQKQAVDIEWRRHSS